MNINTWVHSRKGTATVGMPHAAPSEAGREAYRLTAKGRALRGLMAQIRTWGLAHIEGTEARLQAES